MDINQMQTILQSNLKPNRYAHCLGVMDTAIILAKRFGVDEEQAAIAGLLHDCAREFATEDLIAECENVISILQILTVNYLFNACPTRHCYC